jgi:hypothetical protein
MLLILFSPLINLMIEIGVYRTFLTYISHMEPQV